MSKKDTPATINEIRERLKQLSQTPYPFDQLQRAERVELARILCDDAFSIYQRRKNKPIEEGLWKEAAALFHRAIDEAYPSGFWEDFERLSQHDEVGLEAAILFLEADPWFFRSGYLKADLIRFICRFPISQSDASRLRAAVIRAIDFRDRREFRWYCKLAKVVQSKELRKSVEERLTHEDPGVRRRARWVLSAITHNKSFHINRGIKQYKREQYGDAVGDLTRAILLEPGSLRAFLWRGKAYAKLKRYDDAVADFTHVIDLSASQYIEKRSYKSNHRHLMWMPIRHQDVESYKWRGWTHAQMGKHELAIADYSSVLDSEPNDQYAYRARGRAFLAHGEHERAIDDLNKSILRNPKDAEAYCLRGLVYLAQGQPSWSITEFQRALELEPSDYDTHIGMSNAYFALEQYSEARDSATTAIELRSEAAHAHCCRGKAQVAVGNLDEALSDLTRSIELDRYLWNGEHFYWRSKIYRERGEGELELRDLESAKNAGWKDVS